MNRLILQQLWPQVEHLYSDSPMVLLADVEQAAAAAAASAASSGMAPIPVQAWSACGLQHHAWKAITAYALLIQAA